MTATGWPLEEAGARWGRATGLGAVLTTRVQQQVEHLLLRGVDEDEVRALVQTAAAAHTSVLGAPRTGQLSVLTPVIAAPPPSLVARVAGRHGAALREIVTATGWTPARARTALASELAEAPDGPVDMAVMNVLLAAWAEEFDQFAVELAVELEGGNVAVSRAKLQRAFQLWLVGRDPNPVQMLVALRAIVAAVREQHAVAAAA